MAKKSEQLQMPDLKHVLSDFRVQTMAQIMKGYEVQHLPLTPRERMSRYINTGQGVRDTMLRQFGGDNPDEVGFVFTVPYHMRFAEVGTVGGLRGADVRRSRKWQVGKRYARWNPIIGETHRPSFSPELRHLSRRMGDFLRDFYGQQYMAQMYDALGGVLEEELDFGF